MSPAWPPISSSSNLKPKMKLNKLLLGGALLLAAAFLVAPAIAQVNYSGGTYTQNFDTLPASGTFTLSGTGAVLVSLDAAPISATGLAGWTFSKYAGSGTTTAPLFAVSNGGSNSGSVYSFGTGTDADRALGSLASGSTVSRFGLTLTNTTGQTITQFTLTFTGEQWRRGTASANVLAFSYAIGGTDINTGTFTDVSTLNFTAPFNGTPTGAAIDGNAAANRTVGITTTVTGISWSPNQTLILRWTDVDDGGSDDSLAIDDLTFTAGAAATTPGRLSNLSIRANAGASSDTLIVGFVTSGGTGNSSLLARAGGPALLAQSVSGVLADPVLSVRSATAEVASNNNWNSSLATTFTAVGATPWTTGSLDAAVSVSVAPGPYTALVSGGTGVALGEVYDLNTNYSASNPRLVNLSARSQVGTGDNVMIAGFVVVGDSSVQVLVRGVGPKLSAYGVTGVLADPQLTVFGGSTAVASNNDWSASLAATFTTVGAFALDSGSKDAALLVTLQPGVYTVQVSGVGATTGVALVELYVVP